MPQKVSKSRVIVRLQKFDEAVAKIDLQALERVLVDDLDLLFVAPGSAQVDDLAMEIVERVQTQLTVLQPVGFLKEQTSQNAAVRTQSVEILVDPGLVQEVATNKIEQSVQVQLRVCSALYSRARWRSSSDWYSVACQGFRLFQNAGQFCRLVESRTGLKAKKQLLMLRANWARFAVFLGRHRTEQLGQSSTFFITLIRVNWLLVHADFGAVIRHKLFLVSIAETQNLKHAFFLQPIRGVSLRVGVHFLEDAEWPFADETLVRSQFFGTLLLAGRLGAVIWWRTRSVTEPAPPQHSEQTLQKVPPEDIKHWVLEPVEERTLRHCLGSIYFLQAPAISIFSVAIAQKHRALGIDFIKKIEL